MKRLFDGFAIVLVAPVAALYQGAVLVAPGRRDTAIQGFSQFLSLCPGLIGVFLRRAFYRLTLEHCSPTCSIGFGTLLVTPRIRIGDGVYVGVAATLATPRSARTSSLDRTSPFSRASTSTVTIVSTFRFGIRGVASRRS